MRGRRFQCRLVLEEAEAISSGAEGIESPMLIVSPIGVGFVIAGITVDVIRAFAQTAVEIDKLASYFLAGPIGRVRGKTGFRSRFVSVNGPLANIRPIAFCALDNIEFLAGQARQRTIADQNR